MSPNGVLNKSNSITEQTKKYSVNGKKKKCGLELHSLPFMRLDVPL